jgi:ABC-type multidrug transport system fused ATPase/permease subunit
MTNVVFNATFILFALGSAGAFAGGTYLFRREWVTIGTVYLVTNYTQMLKRPLRTITYQLQHLQRAGAGVGRVREILEAETRLPTVVPSDARTLPSDALSVHFDDVTFAYNDEEVQTHHEGEETVPGDATAESGDVLIDTSVPVLHEISFDLPSGEVLGLLGRTGSGKTTLIRLLLRLYDPDAGAVCSGSGSIISGSAAPPASSFPIAVRPSVAPTGFCSCRRAASLPPDPWTTSWPSTRCSASGTVISPKHLKVRSTPGCCPQGSAPSRNGI